MKCLVKAKFETGKVSVEDINLLHFLKNPSNKPKPELPLWRFITLKEGMPCEANQEYYDKIHMLILEFDKGTTIQEIESLVSEYSYAIHTTSNHTKEAHRFRLMLPLDISYPECFWRISSVKKAMIAKFKYLDKSSFVNYQCIPALPTNPSDYYYKINNGRKFGYDEIEELVKRIELDEEIERQFEASTNPPRIYMPDEGEFNLEGYIEKRVIGRLDGVNWNSAGERSLSMISFCGTWKTASRKFGFDIREVLHVVLEYRMPEEFKKIARKHLR